MDVSQSEQNIKPILASQSAGLLLMELGSYSINSHRKSWTILIYRPRLALGPTMNSFSRFFPLHGVDNEVRSVRYSFCGQFENCTVARFPNAY